MASKLQRIEDVEKPVVGKFYLVRCAQFSATGKAWWPIIGPAHSDPDLDVPKEHYHYDARFLYDWQVQHNTNYRYGVQYTLSRVHNVECITADAFIRRRMKREMPDFPSHSPSGGSKILTILEPVYRDVQMKCLTCPHRGFSLKGMPVKDGAIVCPGHGLQWDVATGKMISRLSNKQ